MYIKDIILDGFKSYAQRTEIGTFDPQFNAITGLNGSGKSNILDGICFLLGISNLSQVRATNLQELVYKSGQAGVTKATVTVTFDNADKKQSPVGYETCNDIVITRQVVVGGRNKYTINGVSATNQRVQDMFRSVQLNVNNPHFLIMQGRVTKVLNMKPIEILSMIEEAAGTRLYESKRELAQKTIDKKDSKLEQINHSLNNELKPSLEKLKDERQSYLDYQKVIREVDQLTKLWIAWQYNKNYEITKKSENDSCVCKAKVSELQELVAENKAKIVEIEKQKKELEEEKAKRSGNQVGRLHDAMLKAKSEMGKMQSVVENHKRSIKSDQRKFSDLQKSQSDDQLLVREKQNSMSKLESSTHALIDKYNNDEQLLLQAQKKFHALSTGLQATDTGEAESLEQQLNQCRDKVSRLESEIKQTVNRLKKDSSEVAKMEDMIKKNAIDFQSATLEFDKQKERVNELKRSIQALQFDEVGYRSLVEKRRELGNRCQSLQVSIDQIYARLPNLNLEYDDPAKQFDRRRVKGVVAKLFKLKENHENAATGLEVVGGGKMWYVVVDNNTTGKLLLEKGHLKRRITLIPLDKITRNVLDRSKVERAKQLVGETNVFAAHSLLEFDTLVGPAVEFVFGSSFICKTSNQAKTVAFNKGTMAPSVSFEGDQFSPAGLLTGGSRNRGQGYLLKVSELICKEDELHQLTCEYKQLTLRLDGLRQTEAKFIELSKQLVSTNDDFKRLETKMKQNKQFCQVQEMNNLKEGIAKDNDAIEAKKKQKQELAQQATHLEVQIRDYDKVKDRELAKAQKGVDAAQKIFAASKQKHEHVSGQFDELMLEISELKQGIEKTEVEMSVCKAALDKAISELDELQEHARNKQDSCDDIEKNLVNVKEILKETNASIHEKGKDQSRLTKEVQDSELKVQELQYQVEKFETEFSEASRRVANLVEKHDWISTEKEYFGKENTAYNFKDVSMGDVERRLKTLDDSQGRLSKNVNMRAMAMLEKAEERFNDLIKKKETVIRDKAQIVSVMKELDEKKNVTLEKAYVRINDDFGSIFKSLLPGAFSKLHLTGDHILDGLEIKVSFGDTWKDSLNELSGGQRSLVALSLILSFLIFKPAPIYILDEIDAALDLSHTQNVGHMIKTHFKNSQFIIVSLKDGMFKNANVLFRTRFVDGVSTVSIDAASDKSKKGSGKTKAVGGRG